MLQGAGCCRREVTPPEVRAAREREKELAELDRDIRTVFAYNLNLKAEEKDLFQFFSTAGKVLDVRIISDRNTRRSKGFAYIEYARRVRPSEAAVCFALRLKSKQYKSNRVYEGIHYGAVVYTNSNASVLSPCCIWILMPVMTN